jgi:GT2 family glycosyltransferase
MNAMPLRFSFIVPFHRGLLLLAQCLRALDARPLDSELIIAADGTGDDCGRLAADHGAHVVAVRGPSGPAVKRNAAVAAASGDVVVFVDADVIVSKAGLTRMARTFHERPQTAAVFGAYDDRPADPGFMSQYKNLSHSFIHHTSAARANTFWAGFGAVRRDAFERVGGFDERFVRPSVEDIDLGYRLTASGYEVLLDPALSATHLKRWTIRSSIVCDVRDRGILWTQLIWRYGALGNDLNLRTEYRLSVLLAYLALGSVLLAPYDVRTLIVFALAVAGLTAANRSYLRFFYAKRGAWFVTRAWVMHLVHNLCNGLSFAVGTLLFFAASLGVRLPGSLPTTRWSTTVTAPERGPARQQA